MVVASLSATQALHAGKDAPDSFEAEPEPIEAVETRQEVEETASVSEVAQVESVETPAVVEPVEAVASSQVVKPVEAHQEAKSTADNIEPVKPVEAISNVESSEAPVVPTEAGVAVAAVEAARTRLTEASPVKQVDEARITERAQQPAEAVKPIEQPVRTARTTPVEPNPRIVERVKPETVEPVVRPVKEPKRTPKKRNVEKPEKKKPVVRKKKSKKRKKTRKKAKERSVASLRKSGSRAKGNATQRAGDRGRSRSVTGRAAMSNYLGRIVSRLQRQKRYPRDARRKKMEGTAVVAFTVRSNGQVSGVRLKRSSGHAALDREARAMVKRAAPFPPMPSDVGRKALPLSVPIDFGIR